MAKNIVANFDGEDDANWYEDRQWVAHAKTDLDDFFGTFLDVEFNRLGNGSTHVHANAHMFINHYSVSHGMGYSRLGVGARYGGAYKDTDGD